MKRSGSAVIAASLGAIGLMVVVAASAQDSGENPLADIMNVRSEGNDAAAGMQKRVDQVSDETDDLLSQYRTALKQIDSIDIYNNQMRSLIRAQDAELVSLRDQLGGIQGVGRSVTPLMLRMVDAIEKFVELDVPFLITERAARIASLREVMNRADVTTSSKFRQVMEAYQIENEYGRTIEAYRDSIEVEGRETTVDFLRFGRISLVYQSLDESQQGRWDQATRSWVSLDSSYRSGLRQGIRIARKQTAPDLIRLPLSAAVNAPGES